METYQNNEQDRLRVIDALKSLVDNKLTSGTSGNISLRVNEGMIITPTGMTPDQTLPEHIVYMKLNGEAPADQLKPSSEWQMHADIYRNKPGINAVVHCHSPYATILACARKAIPPLHYMIAACGSFEIPLAEYATFATKELSEANLKALDTSLACLMANHGQLAIGFDLDGAMKLAAIVEEMAHSYWGTLAIGGPELLNSSQMNHVLDAYLTYGQQDHKDSE
ncbi:class II aldolase/adducin family protein [Agarilytica rhodophyticola]|uniref:class II aldolase/adducin family protein n=1 Tax=Agarilytica rhodophyticola TaxID=1737490 RepID=UPI000B3456BF|nr:class II aldolase/adducin family protein [Agarilytica rhodophyticola]